MVKSLIKLYRENKVLVLLDIAYFALSVFSFLIAGIVALFNQPLGVSILIVPLAALIACVMNVVAWALVKLVMDQLVASEKSKNSKK